MRTPTRLKSLDDRVLGDRLKGEPASREVTAEEEVYPDEPRTRVVEREESAERAPRGDGLREVLGVVAKISRLVFLVLAAILVVGIIFVLAPTNADNALVEFVFDVSETVAGPFRDVFTVSDNAERELIVNYGFAAFVYAVLAYLVMKIPGAKT